MPRPTRSRVSVRASLVALIAVGMLAPPAAVVEAPAPVSTAPATQRSIWDGPWEPTIAEPQVERFLALWAPRVADAAWLDAYLKQDEIPADIRAEGFHDLDAHTRSYLVHMLFERLRSTMPSVLADSLRLPKAELDQEKAILFSFIFDHALLGRFKDALDLDLDAAAPPQEPAADGPSELDERIERFKNTPVFRISGPEVSSAPPVREVPVSELGQVPKRLTEQEIRTAPASPVDAPEAIWTGETAATEAPSAASSADRTSEVRTVDVKPADVRVDVPVVTTSGETETPAIIGFTTYAVCVQSASVNGCTIDTPLGAPALVDVTGDGAPDVSVQLSPSVNPAFPAGAGLGLQMNKIVPGAELKAHVYVVWDAPGSAARVSVGFDGRQSSLADASSVSGAVKDLVQAAGGNVGVNVGIAHTNAQSPASFTFGVDKLTVSNPLQPAVPSDPIRGALRFATVPSNFGIDFDMNRLGGAAEDYKIEVTSSLATVLQPSLTIDNGPARREISGVVDKLPNRTTIRFARALSGELTANYAASAVVDRVAFAMKSTPNRASPGHFNEVSAEVLELPSTVNLAFTPPSAFTYQASSTVPKVTVALRDVAGAAPPRTMSAVAEGVPSQIALSVGPNPAPGPAGQRVSYTSSAVLNKLTLNMNKPDDETVATAAISGIPSSCTLLLAGHMFDAACNAPIGLIDASLSTKNAPVVTLPGDHATLRRAADDGLGARLRISGLQSARVEQRVGGAFASFAFPNRGAQPFRALYQDPSILADAVISNLPASFSVDVQPNAVVYDASEVIAQITAHAQFGATVLNAVLQGLPNRVALNWTTGASSSFTYAASGVLTKILASLQTGPGSTAFDATIQSLPPYMTINMTPDVVSFDARTAESAAPGSGALGSLLLRYGSNGAFLAGLPADDHVALKQTASTTQAQLKFTGIKLASVDTRNDEIHARLLASAPRLLLATADTPTSFVTGVINQLPADVRVDFVGTSIDYRASSTIGTVAFDLDKRNGETIGAVVKGIPASVDIDWTTGLNPSATWSASSSMTGIQLSHRQGPGQPALDATLTGLPPYARVAFGGEQASFDARTSPSAAPGSAALGSIVVKYGSNGTIPTSLPADDHVILLQQASPDRTTVAAKFTGLKLVTLDTRNDEVHGRVLASAPRRLLLAIDTPMSVVYGDVNQVPADVRFDMAGNVVTYLASSAISRAQLFLDKRDTQYVYADVHGVPLNATITVDNTAQRVAWSASSAVTRVTVVGRAIAGGRTWDAFFDVQSVPASWELAFASARPIFRGISGPIGKVALWATNYGAAPVLGGNHAALVYRSATGNIGMSFGMNAMNLVDLQQTAGGFAADLRMGGGGPFRAYIDVVNGLLGAKLDATITPLPTSIQISQNGEEIRYASNANFDLSTYLEAGDTRGILAAPAPPSILNTLSFRDGRGTGCSPCLGFKGRFNLLGFPTSFVSSPSTRTMTITNFRPPSWANYIRLDVDVDDIVTPRTRLLAQQSGIPTGVNFTFGPFSTETLGDGAKRTNFAYNASGGLGDLSVYLERGTDVGQLYISNIPSSISGNVRLANGTSTVSITNSAQINQIQALFKRVSDISFDALAVLYDVPTSVSLTFGKVTFDPSGTDEYTVPGLTYAASASTLDMYAYVGTALFGGDLRARFVANIINLGASTTAGLDGSTAKIRSSPATTNIELHAWGRIHYLRNFSGCAPSSCPTFRVQYGGHAGVVPITINDLMVKATNVSSLDVKLGLTSKVTGSYGSFSFGFQSITVAVDFYGYLQACAEVCVTLVSTPEIHTTFDLTIKWVGATNHEFMWIDYDTPWVVFNTCSWTADWNIVVYMRPHQHFFSGTPANGFTVTAASAEGGAWFLTPNPNGFFGTEIMRLAQAFTADGGGLRVSVECR